MLTIVVFNESKKYFCNLQNQPGVIAFYSAKDIPGVNSSVPGDLPFNTTNENCSAPVKSNITAKSSAL